MGEAGRRLTSGCAAFAAIALFAAAPGAQAAPSGADLGMTIFLQRQAARQAVAYSQIRAEVDDGLRPTGDLVAARRSLKAAQTALYDQIERTQRINDAVFGSLRKQNARRLKDELIRVHTAEAELPTLAATERPDAEARLALSRQVLEGYQANAERLSALPPPAPRPKLPVLPPRS